MLFFNFKRQFIIFYKRLKLKYNIHCSKFTCDLFAKTIFFVLYLFHKVCKWTLWNSICTNDAIWRFHDFFLLTLLQKITSFNKETTDIQNHCRFVVRYNLNKSKNLRKNIFQEFHISFQKHTLCAALKYS